ncbi:DNA processing protein DprA [Formosimonas limnophila]|uniref:DNA processing protein DprA n=1 Tax=Formosimonas limnophila TaxID=1384487 RepID=A0A8J3CN59_9BURK|nr:DNA-processing protein DprA [Formosimonas limnophila]GHA74064.1 DNA processing protein DprA [Formosimonas limnophila]
MTKITEDDLIDWLRLLLTDGVGDITAQKLLSAFGLPHNVFKQSHTTLANITSDKVARSLLAPTDDAFAKQLEITQKWLETPENHVLTLDSPHYPQHLLSTADPPVMLYAKGRIELLNHHPALAIVGSRNATTGGLQNAEHFARELAADGLTVVSGLALGIDAAAHRGALSAHNPHATTIAVIGTGADIIYPARNRDLAHQIAAHGVIISEFPLGCKAIANNFPRRNRIISGLSHGVLIVEAALQSGSLITARQALDQNREVFAIPGSIHSPLTRGCHALIRQGAKLVESAADILEELHLPSVTHEPATQSTDPSSNSDGDAIDNATQTSILQHLGFDPCDLDTLAERSHLSIAELSAELMILELSGRVEKRDGNVYARLS